MGEHFDYFVSDDGTPGDDVMDTTWVDPEVHVGRLYSELNGGEGVPHLVGHPLDVGGDVRRRGRLHAAVQLGVQPP